MPSTFWSVPMSGVHMALVLSNFQRYFSPNIAQVIAQQQDAGRLPSEKRPVVIFFSDIRGFTPMSETMSPDDIATLLTEYFTEMVEVVFEHGGTLDKFMGDAIMALWGAPMAHEDDADRAMRCALDQLAALERLNAKWKEQGRPELGIGVGINFGDLFGREPPKRHVRHVERVLDPPILCHRDRGHDLVHAPRQPPQHRLGLLRGRGLPEDSSPEHDGGIGREYDRASLPRGHRAGLVARQTGDVALGLLGRPEGLVHVGRHHAELEPDHLEQLAPARRSAREDDHFSRIRVTGPSFTSSTPIMAPNSPVATCTPLPAPRSFRSATNRSYSGTASSGGAASMKLGRRPFCTSPYSVN